MSVLVLATRNRGKVGELQTLLAELGVEVRCLADYPPLPEVEEDGDTFDANALKKARAAAEALGVVALADDSGLVVDALDGEPGLYSARYGGPGLSDAQRCDHLLAQLAERGVSASAAHFVCAMALARPDGVTEVCQAQWHGTVRGPARGDQGFGYDPLFTPDGDDVTAAMLPPARKNRLSHRGQAAALVLARLRERPELLA